MTMAASAIVIVFFLTVAPSTALTVGRERLASGSETESRVNPIRRVVSLLQSMQKKITAEGEEELALYEKFGCYCKTSGGTLKESIALAEAKVPEVDSAISETVAKVAQLEEDLKQHQADRSAAKDTMASAKALRAKTAAAFAKDESELSTNIAALTKAISSIESGMVGAFIQSSSAQALRRVIVDRVDMSDFDRQMVASFLGQGSHQGYAPKSGQIVGILKEIKDTMSKELSSATAAETASIKSYDELMAAKKKEILALTASIEDKTERLGEAKVTTADELVAIADTIKVLNDDDALELFKKTLPGAGSASFVQMQARSGVTSFQRQRALQLIQNLHNKDSASRAGIDFIVMAIKGKKVDFEKVLKMIDDMVVLLGKEQTDDDDKKATCELTFDKLEDKIKELGAGVSSLEVTIAQEEDLIATLTEEIKALVSSIAALDASVAEATAQRQAENAAFKELMASDQAAKELLGFAKNRLNKFYQPELYIAPPKVELSKEDKLYTTFGGELSLVQVSAHQQKSDSDVAPPPPPATAAAYKKSADSTGVIYMIDTLINDLTKEMTEASTAETEAQADYETTMGESAAKRAQDTKSMADKEAAKADISADLLKHTEDKTATSSSLMATSKVLADMHGECDWLLQNFEVRKEARLGEVESLKQAKAVLSGADYSLAQKVKN